MMIMIFLNLKKKKFNDEITILFKKTISKMLKSKWVTDFKFSVTFFYKWNINKLKLKKTFILLLL